MTRTRNYARTELNGTWKRFGSTFGLNGVVTEGSTCTDSPGFGLGDNLPFQVDHDYLYGGKINQNVKDGGSYFTAYFDNYTADTFTFSGRPSFPLITSYPGELSNAQYASQTIARTTPSHPSVDVVQNVLEIGDIPRVLKLRGDTILRMTANEYLRLEFGIKPLLKDIKRTLDWGQGVNKRFETIEKIRKTGGFRKTVQLANLSNTQMNNNIALQSAGAFFTDSFETYGNRIIRGHARYLPTVDFSKYTAGDMYAMAFKAYFGAEYSLSGFWEGMPWSWLIDWFTNVGDLLMARRNIVPVTCQGVSLMRHTASASTTHAYNDGIRHIEAATVIKERKERYPASATLDAQMPLLSASQMGILTSLLIMKGKSPYRG